MHASMCCGFAQGSRVRVALSRAFMSAGVRWCGDRVCVLNIPLAPLSGVLSCYREGNPRFDYSYCVGHNGFYDLRLPASAGDEHKGSGAGAAVEMSGGEVEDRDGGGVARRCQTYLSSISLMLAT